MATYFGAVAVFQQGVRCRNPNLVRADRWKMCTCRKNTFSICKH